MSMLDLADLNLGSAIEPKAVEGGKEHQLRIVAINVAQDKNGMTYWQPRVEVVNDPNSKDFTHFLHVPDRDKMDDKKLNQSKWNMKLFMESLGVDLARSIEPNDLIGETFWAILGKKTDEMYGDQNFISQFVRPK
uniref:Uncharacterized protein n=1 Tax=viral metagenome TaxID=1070528 RepID=A0A6M3K8M8_9ZZZZ